jgi:hypothetical protein
VKRWRRKINNRREQASGAEEGQGSQMFIEPRSKYGSKYAHFASTLRIWSAQF